MGSEACCIAPKFAATRLADISLRAAGPAGKERSIRACAIAGRGWQIYLC
jgi:hypothetical protein